MCRISKGTHKKTQSGFHISTEEANVAEISCHRRFQGRGAIANAYCNAISVDVQGFMAAVKSAVLGTCANGSKMTTAADFY